MEYLTGNYSVTVEDECPRNPNPSGYGNKIPTRYGVTAGYNWVGDLPDKRFRRVYAICYSNVASFYILINGVRHFIQDWKLEDARDRVAAGRSIAA